MFNRKIKMKTYTTTKKDSDKDNYYVGDVAEGIISDRAVEATKWIIPSEGILYVGGSESGGWIESTEEIVSDGISYHKKKD